MSEGNHNPVKVLQIAIGDGSYGGVASFLYSYYSHINHGKVHFDFLYCGENSLKSKMNTPVLADSKITTLHIMQIKYNGIKGYIKLLKALRNFFNDNEYDIVHVNTNSSFFCACVAYALKGRAKLIFHSHNSKVVLQDKSRSVKHFLKDVLESPCKKYMLKKGDFFFACSNAAGANLFGKKILKSDNYKVINNAIDISKYAYNAESRNKVRKTDNFVFGHVGRFTRQKNHKFLVELFAEIHKLVPDSELWLVGEGELREETESQIKTLGLEDCVVLWGRRDDVADLMQGMDIFLFPSLYEGLSIVTIEAQASGLTLVVSDSISPEHKVTELVHFLKLEKGTEFWAQEILGIMKNQADRRDMSAEILSAGYEIKQAANELENFYINRI